jgi:hypothetical protein
MCGGGGQDAYAAQARADEVARQQRIKEGMSKINSRFSGFNDAFFNKRAKEFEQTMNPQVTKQYRQANENLAYSLARSGLTDSSERAKSEGILRGNLDTARADIANQGIDRANEQRQSVEQSKGALINQLYSTGDAQAASNAALNAANRLAGQQQYSLLGNLFANTAGMVSDAKTASHYDRNAVGAQPYYNMVGLGSTKETTKKTP